MFSAGWQVRPFMRAVSSLVIISSAATSDGTHLVTKHALGVSFATELNVVRDVAARDDLALYI